MPPAVQLFFCPEFQRPFPLSLFFIHRKTAIAAYIIYRLRVLPVTGSALGPDLGWTISDALNGLTAEQVAENPDNLLPEDDDGAEDGGHMHGDGEGEVFFAAEAEEIGSDGKMVTSSWVKWKDDWYYLKDNGEMAENEWAKDKLGWCYLGKGGAQVKDAWVRYKNNMYYIKPDGYMATGEMTLPCKFNKDGKLEASL